jgi:hypothetical protein
MSKKQIFQTFYLAITSDTDIRVIEVKAHSLWQAKQMLANAESAPLRAIRDVTNHTYYVNTRNNRDVVTVAECQPQDGGFYKALTMVKELNRSSDTNVPFSYYVSSRPTKFWENNKFNIITGSTTSEFIKIITEYKHEEI